MFGGDDYSARFNEMWQKMVTKLEQGKKFTNELVDQSVAAYDQREDICNKIQNLDDKGQVENNLHMQVIAIQFMFITYLRTALYFA